MTSADWEHLFFQGWPGVWRTLIVGVLAYASIVLLLRISGKRTLSRMNAFDLIVSVALGSTLASILLSKDVALAEGIVAFTTLVGLQFLVAWLSVRSAAVGRLVKSEPALLVYQGQYLHDAMRRERVVEAEVLAAVRAQKILSLSDVEAVVLETNGRFSVLPRSRGASPEPDTLAGVSGFPGNPDNGNGEADERSNDGSRTRPQSRSEPQSRS